MKKEINHLQKTPLSEQNERQLLQIIASKNKQQAELAFQEFIKRHNDRLYEFCQDETASYKKDHKKKLTYSLYSELIIYIFDYPNILLNLLKGKRSSLSMQAAIFSHLEEKIQDLFKELLKNQWLDKDVFISLPPKELRLTIGQSVYQDYINQQDEFTILPQKNTAFEQDLKILEKVLKTFKPKDQKFLIMMADPILNKGKKFPQIIERVSQAFELSKENTRQRSLRLFNKLKTDFDAEKRKN